MNKFAKEILLYIFLAASFILVGIALYVGADLYALAVLLPSIFAIITNQRAKSKIKKECEHDAISKFNEQSESGAEDGAGTGGEVLASVRRSGDGSRSVRSKKDL